MANSIHCSKGHQFYNLGNLPYKACPTCCEIVSTSIKIPSLAESTVEFMKATSALFDLAIKNDLFYQNEHIVDSLNVSADKIKFHLQRVAPHLLKEFK